MYAGSDEQHRNIQMLTLDRNKSGRLWKTGRRSGYKIVINPLIEKLRNIRMQINDHLPGTSEQTVKLLQALQCREIRFLLFLTVTCRGCWKNNAELKSKRKTRRTDSYGKDVFHQELGSHKRNVIRKHQMESIFSWRRCMLEVRSRDWTPMDDIEYEIINVLTATACMELQRSGSYI